MSNPYFHRFNRLALLAAGTFFASACTVDTSAPDGEPLFREKGRGSYDNLAKDALSTYRADRAYVLKLARPDVPVSLNLADARQYRFVMARLAIAGKTAENSPHLFEAVEARRTEHIARGYQKGQAITRQVSTLVSADITDMHYIASATLGETTPTPNDGAGTAASTTPGGTFYSYADVDCTDVAGRQIGSPNWIEEFGGGTAVTVGTECDPSQSNLTSFVVSSYQMKEDSNGFSDSLVYTAMGSDAPQISAGPPQLTGLTVDAPLDIKFNDNLISICLNRTWTQDCDYDLTGTWQAVKVPFQGSVTLTSAHILNQAEIDQVTWDLNNGVARDDAGHLKLVLTQSGGGCDVTDGNTLVAKMAQFWNNVTVSADKKTFSWDLSGLNSAFFDDGCRQVQNAVYFTARIMVPVVDEVTGEKARASLTLSNDPDTLRPAYSFKPMQMTNSCLAEGTMIQLANGGRTPIEAIQSGEQVFNPYMAGIEAVTVSDTAKGIETVPMVRIVDESNRSLLMTEMHPIQTVDRGMVQARALQEGDRVMTSTGPSRLVTVSRESYDGHVYNLKVGSDDEKAALLDDQTVMYANGFMVGDGQIQSKYEFASMTRERGDVLSRLPARWHEDYARSLASR